MNIKTEFGTSIEWVYPKLAPIVPSISNIDFIYHLCKVVKNITGKVRNKDDYNKVRENITINRPLTQHYSFIFENKEFRIGDIISSKLIHDLRRIYVKKDPGILFIKVEDSEILKDNSPYKYKIEGVGQGIQEFLPNNENQRILDSKEPLILIKENSQHEFVFYDIAVCESYKKIDTRNGKILEFILRGIRTSD